MIVTCVVNGEIIQWEAIEGEYEATADKRITPEIERLRALSLDELLAEEFPF